MGLIVSIFIKGQFDSHKKRYRNRALHTTEECQVGERVKLEPQPKTKGVIEGDGTSQTVTCKSSITLQTNNCNGNECKLVLKGINGNQVSII